MNVELAECLDEIAAGKTWSESALRAAINEPYLSDTEKGALRRYLKGSQTGVDHVTLQDIALAIRNNHTALDFIKAIASNMAEVNKPLGAILDALEDGEALAYLGVSDEDIDMVEEAHAMVSDWIKDGKLILGE